jgi:nucleotide-binding universal stress UspA family protein
VQNETALYDKVLIPIENLQRGNDALRQVLHLRPPEVVLLGVTEPVATAIGKRSGMLVELSPAIAQEVVSAEQAVIGDELHQARRWLVEHGWSGPTTLEVRQGHRGMQIVQCASEMDCDVVLLTAAPRGRFARLFGSNTDYVVDNLDAAAVLLLRPLEAQA